jgi:ABC-type antimicrobial peptide transport system permease subunit
MISVHPLVTEHFRHNDLQAMLNSLGIALAVMMMLTLAGASLDSASHPNKLIIAVRFTVVAVAWVATGATFLFMAINRFSQVRERTRQFAILRVLGGSLFFILTLLLQETLLIAVPGTIVGILFAYLHEWLISTLLGGLFVLRTPYDFWLPAGLIAALVFFVSSSCAAWLATRLEVLDALAYED